MEKLKIIALLGRARAGKDTAGRMLLDIERGGTTMAFADKLKQICMEMFDMPEAAFYTDAGKEEKTKFANFICFSCKSLEVLDVSTGDDKLGQCKLCGSVGDLRNFKNFWTGRTIAQHIGTEGFRRVYPDVWVNYVIRKARQQLASHAQNVASAGKTVDAPAASVVVITDCRFKNEAEAVLAVGGEVWRIRRPEADKGSTGIVGHSSEMEQNSIPDSMLQAVIHNDGSLDSLRAKIVAEYDRFSRKY